MRRRKGPAINLSNLNPPSHFPKERRYVAARLDAGRMRLTLRFSYTQIPESSVKRLTYIYLQDKIADHKHLLIELSAQFSGS
jgi:hypothetical protein